MINLANLLTLKGKVIGLVFPLNGEKSPRATINGHNDRSTRKLGECSII